MRQTLAIIILNYRTPELVFDCLNSLNSEIVPGIRVIVVDNDSKDGSAAIIEQAIASNAWTDWASVLRSPINGGFAAGNNLGIQAIDADAYLLLNSDTIIKKGAVRELLHAQRLYPNAGLIGPSMEDENGQITDSAFALINPVTELIRSAQTGPISRLLSRYDIHFSTENSPAEPEWIGFACVLIAREIIDRIGLLDDGFFMYFEDIDYCRRVRDAGWKILYWPKARIVHLLGASSGVTSSKTRRRRRPRYFYEARSRYFAKYYGLLGLWSANFMWILGLCVFFTRQFVGSKKVNFPEREARDLWINVLHPLRPRTKQTGT